MHVVVHDPWRETPKGELTLLLDPDEPSLHLARLKRDGPVGEGDAGFGTGDPVEKDRIDELVGPFTLHRSPDDRVPDVAETVAGILAETKPAWLEDRVLELLNNIHGFGTSRNPRGAAAKAGADHPLAPLGLWGPTIDQVGRAVRKGRFEAWEELRERLEPMAWGSIEEALPEVLRDDILGVRTPRMLLREPL